MNRLELPAGYVNLAERCQRCSHVRQWHGNGLQCDGPRLVGVSEALHTVLCECPTFVGEVS